MRFILAAIFVGALGASAASALPAASRHSLSLTKANPLAQVVRHKHSRSHRHGHGDGGIHPLVGSGDY